MIFQYELKTTRSYLHSSGQNTGMWRTDGQTESLWLVHCEQCGRTVMTRVAWSGAATGELCCVGAATGKRVKVSMRRVTLGG